MTRPILERFEPGGGFGNWDLLLARSQRTYSKYGRSRFAGVTIQGSAGERDALKTSRSRADNTCVLCQCSAPKTHATRRFTARYCTRRERQARHRKPEAG